MPPLALWAFWASFKLNRANRFLNGIDDILRPDGVDRLEKRKRELLDYCEMGES